MALVVAPMRGLQDHYNIYMYTYILRYNRNVVIKGLINFDISLDIIEQTIFFILPAILFSIVTIAKESRKEPFISVTRFIWFLNSDCKGSLNWNKIYTADNVIFRYSIHVTHILQNVCLRGVNSRRIRPSLIFRIIYDLDLKWTKVKVIRILNVMLIVILI